MLQVKLARYLRSGLWAVAYSMLGALVMLVITFILYMNSRADLDVWHLVDLDEEYTEDAEIGNFNDYLQLEQRLFKQLDEMVYETLEPGRRSKINRYSRGSLSDPGRWQRNWNHSFELNTDKPRAGVLLLHGMSDSPYSLRNLGMKLNESGAYVLGLRLPGHGTAPAGLTTISPNDLTAAVRIAMRHLSQKMPDKPLYIVGYSTGASLAMQYSLDTLDDASLARVNGLFLMSPAIGVTPVAALAIWQSRLGRILGLRKLAWDSIKPEYDPYKYNSFAVNAGNVVYQLTSILQERLKELNKSDKLKELPPILAFSSAVDATVSTSALVHGLFQHLPVGKHELVVFDINRESGIDQIIREDPLNYVEILENSTGRPFSLKVVTNKDKNGPEVVLLHFPPGIAEPTKTDLPLKWPSGVYSLTHVALPFSVDDPLYGVSPDRNKPGVQLGNIALRGERGVLQIDASELLRLRWNPFHPYLEQRLMHFTGLD